MQLVLAEDNALLRDGLTRILEAHDLTIRHSVANAPELEVALADPEVDAAVLDVRLPPTLTDEGLRAAIAVRAARPGFPVLVLSQWVEHLYARELLASGEGGVGYLLKDRVGDIRDFVDAVRRVAGGGTVLDPEVVAALMARPRARAVDRLSPRDRRLVSLRFSADLTQAEIGEDMGLSAMQVSRLLRRVLGDLRRDLGADGITARSS